MSQTVRMKTNHVHIHAFTACQWSGEANVSHMFVCVCVCVCVCVSVSVCVCVHEGKVSHPT